MGFYRLQNYQYFNKKRIVDTDVVNDVTSTRQVLLHVWSYDFYDDVIHRKTATSYDKTFYDGFDCWFAIKIKKMNI